MLACVDRFFVGLVSNKAGNYKARIVDDIKAVILQMDCEMIIETSI